MPNLVKITINNKYSIHAKSGSILSEILFTEKMQSGQTVFDEYEMIQTPCGGMKKCAKCRVKATGGLSALSSPEQDNLTPSELEAGIRLACCCSVVGDCAITLPDKNADKIKMDGAMPHFVVDPIFDKYAVAVDIGTTTLAAHLYSTHGRMQSASDSNPQTMYGADVITRIGHALSSADNAASLADCVRTAVGDLITQMCDNAQINVMDIDTAVITGNTTMLYLLTGLNPKSLSHAPFEADFLFGNSVNAAELRLPCKNAVVHLPPCISAFIGADITTAILASEMCDKNETSVLTDIGTNGEIALFHDGELLCCSTAAGPACEGAGITMGMRGAPGAIDHVFCKDNKNITAHVIGDIAPTGICGSGVIDAIACLLKTGAIDETGFMEDDEAVILNEVVITQSDVRMIQLAKSAICAGIETMIELNHLPPDNIDAFYVAGGFGSYLNINSAADIGLVPSALAKKANVLGNAALSGACAMLLSRQMYKKATDIAKSADSVELSTSSIFSEKYTLGMMFE